MANEEDQRRCQAIEDARVEASMEYTNLWWDDPLGCLVEYFAGNPGKEADDLLIKAINTSDELKALWSKARAEYVDWRSDKIIANGEVG